MSQRAISWCPLQGATRAYAKQAKDITEAEAQAMGFVSDEDFTALDRFGWRMDEAFGVEAWRDVWVWLAEHEVGSRLPESQGLDILLARQV